MLVRTHARSRVGAHDTHASDVADVRDERDGVNRRVQPPVRSPGPTMRVPRMHANNASQTSVSARPDPADVEAERLHGRDEVGRIDRRLEHEAGLAVQKGRE